MGPDYYLITVAMGSDINCRPWVAARVNEAENAYRDWLINLRPAASTRRPGMHPAQTPDVEEAPFG